MCDYSLMSIQNRLAICGEELVVHRFQAGSMGLVSLADLETTQRRVQPPARGFLEKLKRELLPSEGPQYPVVCIPPGARLLLRDIPKHLQRELRLDSAEQEVVFTEIATTGYRDAVRFATGLEVLLQRLSQGQRVLVLALPLQSDEETPVSGGLTAMPSAAVPMS